MTSRVIIDCISDLHGHYPKLQGGDILIVAGDLTASDLPEQYFVFEEWLAAQPYNNKIVIAGNHDNFLIENGNHMFAGIDYLCDSSVTYEGLTFYGTPWSIRFKNQNPNCCAFTVKSEDELSDKMENIPHDIDILITHEAPYGIRDMIRDQMYPDVRHVGSRYLYNWFKYVQRPYLHVFGHIHEGYGVEKEFMSWEDKYVTSVNASHVNAHYNPVNQPIRVELNVSPIQLLSRKESNLPEG